MNLSRSAGSEVLIEEGGDGEEHLHLGCGGELVAFVGEDAGLVGDG
jgi:hypothetical protein